MSSSLFFLGWPDAADLSSHAAYQLPTIYCDSVRGSEKVGRE